MTTKTSQTQRKASIKLRLGWGTHAIHREIEYCFNILKKNYIYVRYDDEDVLDAEEGPT